MKQNRQSKVVAILALCVSILGLTLGFAAFSNTLTISSSAIVTPDSSDFKVRAYGLTFEAGESPDVNDINSYISNNRSVPFYSRDGRPLSWSDALISEDGLTISNINVNFQNLDELVAYYFAIKNEGKYDAYLDLQKLFSQIKNMNIVCTAREGTRQDLVDQSCENIGYAIMLYDMNNDYIFEKNVYHKLSPGEYMFLILDIMYGEYLGNNKILADGDFDVEIDDITFDFSTVAPSE